jgi:hypothetical protein
LQLENFEIQTSNNLLFCQLSDAAISIAVSQFGAQQVEQIQHPHKPLSTKQTT